MGDNRANSRDSRFFGPVPYENIEGEAFLLFWPLDRIGPL
jgi:signal peptidase I